MERPEPPPCQPSRLSLPRLGPLSSLQAALAGIAHPTKSQGFRDPTCQVRHRNLSGARTIQAAIFSFSLYL